jgi:hypothetical protein
VFNQLLVATFVRDSQVTLEKATLDDRLEAFQIRRHGHHSVPCVGHGDRNAGRDDAKFVSRDAHCGRGHPLRQSFRESR